MLDRDGVLTVSGEFRNDVGSPLVEIQFPVSEQNPDSRGNNGFGATKHAIQGCVGGRFVITTLHRMTKRLHSANFSITRDRDLARGQQSLGDLALSALEKLVDPHWVEAHLARMLRNLMSCRHCQSPRLNL